MKTKLLVPFLLIAASVCAQEAGKVITFGQEGGKVTAHGSNVHVFYRGELGKWWQNPEIAKILGISQMQVAVVVHRTRKQLQKELKPYLGGRS